MDGRDLRARVARGRAIAVTSGWAAMSGASGALARTAGLLARGSARLALAMRALRRRLDRLALTARDRARPVAPAATPAAEVLADATVVMPLPPVVPGLADRGLAPLLTGSLPSRQFPGKLICSGGRSAETGERRTSPGRHDAP